MRSENIYACKYTQILSLSSNTNFFPTYQQIKKRGNLIPNIVKLGPRAGSRAATRYASASTYTYTQHIHTQQINIHNSTQLNTTLHNSKQPNSQHNSPRLNTTQQTRHTRQTRKSLRPGETESFLTKLLQFIQFFQFILYLSTDATDATVGTTRRSRIRSNQTPPVPSVQSAHFVTIIDCFSSSHSRCLPTLPALSSL